MDVITNLVAKGNSFLWSFLLIVLLCGTGIYYTIRLRFIQVRKFARLLQLKCVSFSITCPKDSMEL